MRDISCIAFFHLAALSLISFCAKISVAFLHILIFERRFYMQEAKKSIKIILSVIIIFSFLITASAADSLIPLGNTAGIKLHSSGAIIIDMSEGAASTPARAAGLAPGDVIMSIDGAPIHSNSELRNAVTGSEGKALTIEFMRDGKLYTKSITPQKNDDGEYALGIWIRDRLAGIGTMTFLDAESGEYGALGHGISDSDTGLLIPLEEGELIGSEVSSVKKGKCGNPGELIGEFKGTDALGSIEKNTESGIFGHLENCGELSQKKSLPIAGKEEIRRGKATILSNIEGDSVEEYEIEITAIYHDNEATKNMLIRATDPRLIEKTGGIVRGMSGSPIIQDGKLVGAVTHVLVNDPKKGYAIFIENMLDAAG